MMFRNNRLKKTLSLFFLFTLVYQIGFPVAAYALTSGPTAPETSSFEPVDMKDMVNLQTGDFTYNMPLLEVPGPEGGYPVSLAYHAGIQTNEDASWVGLGWALNPGAITRSENGYADDDNGVDQFGRTYWSGTESRMVGFDIGIGLRNASVSFGLTFTNNNNKGFSVDFDGVTIGLQEKAGLVGGPYASAGMSLNLKTLKTSSSVGVGLSGVGSMGVSMESSSQGASFYANGQTGISGSLFSNMNSRDGVHTESSNGGFSIPLFGLLNLGIRYSYYRTWMDYTTNQKSYGSLFLPEGISNNTLDNKVYDTYHMFDLERGLGMFELPDPSHHTGASLPDYDHYMVTAQGLSGAIRPYQFQSYVMGGNRASETGVKLVPNSGSTPVSRINPTVRYQIPDSYRGNSILKTGFRFVNDFSNTYRQSLTDYSAGSFRVPFDENPAMGALGTYDPATNTLEGSRHIDYFSDADIVSGAAKAKGFIDVSADNAVGYNRYSSSRIGGFSITNEKGITYHYSLPVYNIDGIIYSRNVKKADNEEVRWSKQIRRSQYAYNWLLTSITGPDFVDRDGNGIANEGDYGYWVNLGYGKWTGTYYWRTPATGYTRDVDDEFESYSHGSKELYYLNKIKTRTHTAIFEKDLRVDGRGEGVAYSIFSDASYTDGAFSAASKRTLKLNRILLLNNSDATGINPANGAGIKNVESTVDLGANVIDKYDLQGTGIESKAIKIIEFNHDYSLCQGTINSFEDNTPNVKQGKLTLMSINTPGKQGISVLPPVQFVYDIPASDRNMLFGGDVSIDADSKGASVIGTLMIGMTPKFYIGELVSVTGGDNVSYSALVTATQDYYDQNNKHRYKLGLRMVDPFPPGYVSTSASVASTKNPNYSIEAYDKWGMYKADYNAATIADNINVGRMTTPVSSMHADAWSLHAINTQLGANIEMKYEGDSYSKIVLDNRCSMIANSFAIDKTNKQITFKVANNYGVPLSELLAVGSKADMIMAMIPADDLKLLTALISTRNETVSMQLTRIGGNYPIFGPKKQLPLTAGFIIKSVDNFTNTVVMSCNDNFVLGLVGFQYNTDTRVRLSGYVMSANIFFYPNNDPVRPIYGGGIRVKELRINSTDRVSTTKYDYRHIVNGGSSGVTTYEPNMIQKHDLNYTGMPLFDNQIGDDIQKWIWKAEYREMVNPAAARIFSLSRLLPSPGVLYGYVRTTTEVYNYPPFGALGAQGDTYTVPGSTVYSFRVPEENMVELSLLSSTSGGGGTTDVTGTRNYSIQDNTASIGSLNGVGQVDSKGAWLTWKTYRYVRDEADREGTYSKYAYQGRIIERFGNRKKVTMAGSYDTQYGIATAKTENPNILMGEAEYNYKTGQISSEDYLAYDFYSGQLTQKLNKDVYGNLFLTEVIPAYRKYPAMGMKVTNRNNKHMLAQEAGNYVYKVDANNNKLGLVSAAITTWSSSTDVLTPDNTGTKIVQNGVVANNGNVWRKQSTYVWAPSGSSTDGITPLNQFTDFNWTNPSSLANAWLKTAETTLYDVYSKELEAKDVNGNYAATVMGYNNTKVLVSGVNARQKDLAYSGAEDDLVNSKFSGQVSLGDGVVEKNTTFPAATAHTGYNSLKVDAGKNGFSYTVPLPSDEVKKPYMASVWVAAANSSLPAAGVYYQVNGGAPVPVNAVAQRKVGSWYQVMVVVPASTLSSATSLTFGCKNSGTSSVYFDDFRVQPAISGASAYVYDKFTGEVTYILDKNNFFTRFEYDIAGRVKATYKESLSGGVVKAATMDYNYGKGQ